MNRETSIYLDFVRFGAALTVFFSHLSGQRFTAGLFWHLGPYGTEAVDVFFVLSGFVIAYVYDQREHTPREYAVSRLARIYSVALPALVATFVLDAIGRHADPGAYGASWGFNGDSVGQALASIFFVQCFWHMQLIPGSDLPYWSLGFEVWYYIIFAVAVFAPRKWGAPAIIVILAAAGPFIACLFPLWLMGVLAYRICSRRNVPRSIAARLCLWPIMAWILYEACCWHLGRRPIFYNWTQRQQLVQDWIIGTLFTLHLVGFRFVSDWPARLLLTLERPIRWFAGATLTLYLFHLPLAQALSSLSPWNPHSPQERCLIYVGVLMLVFAIAEVTERRKKVWRSIFGALIDSIPAPGRRRRAAA